MESVMISLEVGSNDSDFYDIEQDAIVTEFVMLMQRDRFHWSNGRFRLGEDISLDQTKDIEQFGIPTVNKELNRALEQLKRKSSPNINTKKISIS